LAEARELFGDPARYERHNADARDVYYIPVVTKDQTLGVIGLGVRDRRPDRGYIAFANIVAGQAAMAMELRRVSRERTQTLMEAEREKVRSNLLRSISHDLRTPLTGILSASSILLDKTGDQLAADIKENSEWLISMVENLLLVTRISEDGNKVKKKPEIAEEAMARAVAIVRQRFSECGIQTRAPDEPLTVPMDAMLISQVLINLLENAAKNSPGNTSIFFDLDRVGQAACFTVSDSGNGIPAHLLDNLFEPQTADNGKSIDSVSGMGLGLSICKTIVQAHGGTISGENKSNGGARFTVYLPLDG
jgi:two-component system sensor histidine kinase KdpD